MQKKALHLLFKVYVVLSGISSDMHLLEHLKLNIVLTVGEFMIFKIKIFVRLPDINKIALLEIAFIKIEHVQEILLLLELVYQAEQVARVRDICCAYRYFYCWRGYLNLMNFIHIESV